MKSLTIDNQNFNVIGDIEGRFKTLMALLDKMPKDAKVLSLGDVNDRGHRTPETIDYLMQNGLLVQSNHQHMMVEEYKQKTMPGAYPRYYHEGLWPERNGGDTTVKSYAKTDDPQILSNFEKHIPKTHIDYLDECPLYIKVPGFIMTHAPIHVTHTMKSLVDIGDGFANPKFFHVDQKSENSVLWNRSVPKKANTEFDGFINLFGHNSSNKVKLYNPEFPSGIKIDQDKLTELLNKKDCWGICLDTSGAQILTGLHLPTMTLYSQEFLD